MNGLQKVSASSHFDSNSPKSATAFCPADKVVVGTGYEIDGGKRGDYPLFQTDVVVDDVFPLVRSVNVAAYEEEPTSADWQLTSYAICANAP